LLVDITVIIVMYYIIISQPREKSMENESTEPERIPIGSTKDAVVRCEMCSLIKNCAVLCIQDDQQIDMNKQVIPETSILDLPPELHVRIIELSNLALKDRASLRATCKSMEAAMASSDFWLHDFSREYGTVSICQKSMLLFPHLNNAAGSDSGE
ncbi:hypothetical protein PFISCL1PPCAC_12126, partial [Pristionchus fissidentatus]